MTQDQSAKTAAIRAAVATQLKAARVLAGLTQAQTAAATGVNVATIARIEQGKRDLPVELLFRLADALDFEPGAFLDAAEELRKR